MEKPQPIPKWEVWLGIGLTLVVTVSGVLFGVGVSDKWNFKLLISLVVIMAICALTGVWMIWHASQPWAWTRYGWWKSRVWLGTMILPDPMMVISTKDAVLGNLPLDHSGRTRITLHESPPPPIPDPLYEWLHRVDLLVDAGYRHMEGEWSNSAIALQDLVAAANDLSPLTQAFQERIQNIAHDHPGLAIHESWQNIRLRTAMIVNPLVPGQNAFRRARDSDDARNIATQQIERSVAELRASLRLAGFDPESEQPNLAQASDGVQGWASATWQVAAIEAAHVNESMVAGAWNGETHTLSDHLRQLRRQSLNQWQNVVTIQQSQEGGIFAAWREANDDMLRILVILMDTPAEFTRNLERLQANLQTMLGESSIATQPQPSGLETSESQPTQGS